MPPKGPLAAVALKKYGPHVDERSPVMERMLERPKMAAVPHAHVRSDMRPRYGPLVFRAFPKGCYETHRSRQGQVKQARFSALAPPQLSLLIIINPLGVWKNLLKYHPPADKARF
jgi:hypothetical protein